MSDLLCPECNWFEFNFDQDTEIADYMEKTDLIETHFADQDCPKCGAEESITITYPQCPDCGEAEPDCCCDIDERDLLGEEEAEKMREDVIELVKQKIEETNMEKEHERLRFKENDLRLIAQELLSKHYGGDEVTWG